MMEETPSAAPDAVWPLAPAASTPGGWAFITAGETVKQIEAARQDVLFRHGFERGNVEFGQQGLQGGVAAACKFGIETTVARIEEYGAARFSCKR